MTRRPDSGFSMVELMVAVLVVGIGITALVGSSALATRQIGRARIMTLANEVAIRRLELLRLAGRPAGGSAPCSQPSFASGASPVVTSGIAESWTVGGTSTTRALAVTVTYPVAGRTASFTLRSIVGCY